MPRRKLLDTAVLRAALEGLELQRQRLEAQMAEVQRLLARRGRPTVASAPARPKRTVSAAGRKRIAAAQRKRWAEFKARQAAQAAKGRPRTR